MALIESTSITGYDVEIHAYASGRWEIILDGTSIGSGDTLDKAKAQARTALAKRKVKVNVPFVTRDGTQGFAYAIHAKSRKPMVQIGGTREEWTGMRFPFKPEIPSDVLAEYIEANKQSQAAQRQMRLIENEWEINLSKVVREAVEAAAEQAVTESAA